MFIDRARIKVTAGAGGNGCCSFRREKYVPYGGPNGGDGGDGGDVIIVADSRYNSLLDVHYHPNWKGKRGVHGEGSDCHGKRGETVIIHVPLGTVVRDTETEELLADLTEEGNQFVAAKGGKGGRGNARFANSTNRVPRFAEKGEPGQEGDYLLELKLIAEVGLVGLPNAGKSTFLSHVTAANPKIGDYPFTTLSPNLGVVTLSGFRTMTVADIPGIIEGAAEGKGLGHDFLRHIERTKVLLFLIDTGDEDPRETLRVLENELSEFSEEFASRPKFVAFNKSDITENRERYDGVSAGLKRCYFISAATGDGIPELLENVWTVVDRLRQEDASNIDLDGEDHAEITFNAPYILHETEDGFRVDGRRVLRVVQMTDFENEEAIQHMQYTLEKMGLFKALKRLGAHEGQTIHIGDVELEYRD